MTSTYSGPLAKVLENRKRLRLAVFAASIDCALADPTGQTVATALIQRVSTYQAPAVFWTRDSALNYVCKPATKLLLDLVAASWEGDLQDLELFSFRLALQLLPSQEEQVEVLRNVAFYRSVRASLSSRQSKLQLVNGIKMKTSDAIPVDVMGNLQSELTALETALKAKDPMMPHHLQRSHAMLKDYPELLNLLDREEVALIIDALEIHTKTEIVKASTKTKAGNAKAAKLSASDL